MRGQGAFEAREIVHRVVQCRRVERKKKRPHGLVAGALVWERNRDRPRGLVGDQPPFDFLLFGNEDGSVTFHDRLAGERISRFDVRRRQPDRRTPPHAAALYDDSASSAPPLPAARLDHVQPGIVQCFGEQHARRRDDGFVGR